MFHVVRWDTRQITQSCKTLGMAKRWARGAGHTGEDSPLLTAYPPIAYVANDAGELVYNPRFGKRIGDAAGGVVNSLPSDYFQ